MNRPSPAAALHPMRVVARRTGLTPDLVRAWERRYHVVAPSRSEGGQRLYSDQDIERLSLLRQATDLGRNISQVAGLDLEALAELVGRDLAAAAPRSEGGAADPSLDPAAYLRDAAGAIEALDGHRLEEVLRQAMIALPAGMLMEGVIAPILKQVGARWHQGTLRPSHEHLASVTIRRVLGQVLAEARAPAGALAVLVTTPAGQVHELGALLVAATVALEGWRVIYLGPDLPAEDIAATAARTAPELIALSVIYPLDDPGVHEQLGVLRQLVEPRVGILLGGSGADSYRRTAERLGIRILPGLADLRATLRHARAAATA